MSEPFLAEIIMFGGNFAPRGWALCDGQILPINQNQALFSLLGTSYGGDGRTTFGLPDLRGRAPIHPGRAIGTSQDFALGQRSGNEDTTLTLANLPAHSHTVSTGNSSLVIPCGNDNEDESTPSSDHSMGPSPDGNLYTSTPTGTMAGFSESIAPQTFPTGTSLPYTNMQPSLTITFIIAIQGLFPSRS